MPDISLCQNKKCKVREHCRRFTATPSEHRQSYCSFGRKDNRKCKYFIESCLMKEGCLYESAGNRPR
jgi:hypothetical protein